MKIQNLAIIFIVIIIPILMLLGYYLKLQQDTLEMQSDYNAKLSTSVKEGIKAYEINTVNWRETKGETRRNVTASVNTFLTSLANNLEISGTAKEYMVNYVPAIAMTMYSGYYIYSPSYVPKTIENDQGVQLYWNGTEITTDMTTGSLNDVIYEPRDGATNIRPGVYKYTDEQGIERQKPYTFTTDATQAVKTYKHTLSNEIAYSGTYKKGNTDVTINYTLDNRIYVYGKSGTENINEQGCLVYFDSGDCKIPRITISGAGTEETDITVNTRVDKTIYNGSNINAEILTEQILYKESETAPEQLGTFKYIYDIEGSKLYYDETANSFFTLKSNKVKSMLTDTDTIKVGSDGCKYKSVSVLTSDSTYKKLYQVLNGRDKGKWYISLEDDAELISEVGPGVEVVDTELKTTSYKYGFSAIYMDYSAISYYVEAYAFTNWIENKLGGQIIQNKVIFDEQTKRYRNTTETIQGLFNITADNDIEKNDSKISEHKREIMIGSINSNLNLSISNYSENSENEYRLPVLTDEDWDKVFQNISMIAFFQGVPIGLKTYNNYAIATSTLNRDYVDPDGIYFSSLSESYHRPYCKNLVLADIEKEYIGYRSVEYSLRTYMQDDKTVYYYQHTKQPSITTNSDLACYYCLINKANYEKTIDKSTPTTAEKETINIQAKAYKEALARERYYQNEAIAAKLGVMITYHENLEVEGAVTGINNMPEDQEVEIGELTPIASQVPIATTNNPFLIYKCVGWSTDPNSSTVEYTPGESYSFTEDVDLYAIWTISLSNLEWTKDYYWVNDGEPFEAGNRDVPDGSVSYVYIDEMEDGSGSRVQMIGNNNLKGKGAVWTQFNSDSLEILDFSFDYYINAGHSFNAGGFLFNLVETDTTLEGYMLSINFRGRFKTLANEKNGAIYKFKYIKDDNTSQVEELELVQELNIGTYSSSVSSSGSGSIKIEVLDNGYKISGSELSQDYTINVDNVIPNKFGFFSDHFGQEEGHNCSNIGHFKLTSVKVSVTSL